MDLMMKCPKTSIIQTKEEDGKNGRNKSNPADAPVMYIPGRSAFV